LLYSESTENTRATAFLLFSLLLIDFVVIGFGFFHTTEHAQIVTVCSPFTMQTPFAAHIFTFFLKRRKFNIKRSR